LLRGGYSVRLWLSPAPTSSDNSALSSTPVIELLRDTVHVQWLSVSLGFPWTAHLTCLAATVEPNCVVTSIAGAHAGAAEVVLLRAGALIAPPQARVVFDTGAPHAVDLDHDGYLDIVGSDNDYQPDYASGHNFWATYRFHADALTETGCVPAPVRPEQPPDHLLYGQCPARPGGSD
jgi:hypothetical protein